MSEKTAQTLQDIPAVRTPDKSRLFPFIIAVFVCSSTAFALGYGSWYFFGSHTRSRSENTAALEIPSVETINTEPAVNAPAAVSPVETSEPNPPAETTVEGTVKVVGGEITTGGGDTERPLKRSLVEDFSIAETEVTNARYAEFVKETGHNAPPGWKNDTFPEGTDDFPVVNVSWRDANAFCQWLGKKLGLPVRLPTEAEWELAARGSQGNKYPWGNDWSDEAALSKKTGGKISAVKSFPLNRSPFGAYDMAGNVWEWTQDKITTEDALSDDELAKLLKRGRSMRVVKGGTANDPQEQISAQARYEMPENTKHPHIGFRYIISRKE